MKRNIVGLTLASLLLLVLVGPASAEIRSVSGNLNDVTLPPFNGVAILQGTSRGMIVVGPFVDFAESVSVSGSGVLASISTRRNTAPDGSTGQGTLILNVDVGSSASTGSRTVTIHYRIGSDTFGVVVIRKGLVTEVDLPQINTATFQEANITVHGQNIGNAGVKLPSTSINSAISGVTASIVSGTESQAVVRIRFPVQVSTATLQIELFDKACTGCNRGANYKGATASLGVNAQSSGTLDIRLSNLANVMRAITFPVAGSCGTGCFKVGDVFTIQLELERPAKSGGELINWVLVPPGGFAQASPQTPYRNDGSFNRITIPGGDSSIRLSISSSACPGTGASFNIAKIQTWIGSNTNTTQAPVFKEQTFQINCRP